MIKTSPKSEGLYSTLQTGLILRVSFGTVRRLARTGNLGHRKIGRNFWFSIDDLNEFRQKYRKYLPSTEDKASKTKLPRISFISIDKLPNLQKRNEYDEYDEYEE